MIMTHLLGSNVPDIRGIDTLIKALLSLKDPNGTKAIQEELWVKDTVKRFDCGFATPNIFFAHRHPILLQRLSCLENWKDDQFLVSEASSSLQNMRKAGALLVKLQESLAKATETLESKLLPFEFGKGLSSLPDSVVSQILEFECSRKPRERGIAVQTRLSLVCRRFRYIVSTSPRLWGSIWTSCLEIDAIPIFLERSKAAGLDVYFKYPDLCRKNEPKRTSDKFLRMLSAAIPHSQRWENITLDFTSKHGLALDDAVKPLESLRLPRLHTLVIAYPVDKLDNDDPYPSWEFYKTLEMPKLCTLIIRNAVPQPFTAPLLTSLTINLRRVGFYVRMLSEFLAANCALERLELDLYASWVYDPQDVMDAMLANVKVLVLRLGDTPLDRLYQFRKALHTPNVRKVVLNVRNEIWGDHYRTVEANDKSNAHLSFALCQDNFPFLEYLSFTHSGGGYDNYNIPFKKLPSLHTLKLRTRSRPDEYTFYNIPPLRALYVHWPSDYELCWRSCLSNFHRSMLEQGTLSRLEQLIIDCDVREHEEEMNKLFGKRVAWECWY